MWMGVLHVDVFVDFSSALFQRGVLRGESTQSCEARFSPSSSPFPGTQLLQVVGMCKGISGAMDSTVSAAES